MLTTPVALPDGYRPQYDGQPDYFRLNIRAMPIVRLAMDRAGAFDTSILRPDLESAWLPTELSIDRFNEIHEHLSGDEPLTPEPGPLELVSYQAALARLDELLATRSARADQVPWFKFTSNDGWLVSPEECRAIATALGRNLSRPWRVLSLRFFLSRYRSDAMALLRDWTAFNNVAADHGGYRVH